MITTSPTAPPLGPELARAHTAWLHEVRSALDPAQLATAGPWARWQALRYLQTTFPARVACERRLVESLADRVDEGDRACLWALGELLELLPMYLGRLTGLCHQAGAFAQLTARIVTGLECWCVVVERVIGPLSSSEVPEDVWPGTIVLPVEG